ncbi:DUF2167 domain-containing protein [Arenimonas oryziterrae]|uniref:Membrane-anchored protein n=1 Tax=Arenimonas oryziterrae DSM 21050 = YC6267 TaxID=1121015 RepID=A0A091BI04_9GAMM|nr:DUF2167 domain-containing protein [Arenimonas oryziterrae]KFN43955.1 hypothetical protein N789_08375 [Arenimonas oryziterrae DSM 21050 = YC6267]
MHQILRAALLACAVWTSSAAAQEEAADAAKLRQFVQSLHFQTGEIALPSAAAHLQVAPGFRYLGHDDTRRVLEELWGNPPDDEVLGLLVPDNAPLDSDHSWAVLVTYSDEGYVSDEDAQEIDYTKMLAELKQDTSDGNEERKKNGYETVELIGWAQPPRYDASGKRLYWAKELHFDGVAQNTLNYDIRVLGRKGFLSLNAIAGMSELAPVKAGMDQVLPMAQFDSGARYADFQPGSDKLAAYGLAALVGGGIAAKSGLFAKLGLLLLGLKKFLVVGLVAIGAFVKKLFGGGRDKNNTVR